MIVDTMPGGAAADTLKGMLEATAGQVLRAGEIVRRLRKFMSHGRTAYRAESLPRLITEANALALVGTREHGIEVEITLDPEAEQARAGSRSIRSW